MKKNFVKNRTKLLFPLDKNIDICYNTIKQQCMVSMDCKKEELKLKITITAKKMQIPQNFTEYAEKRLAAKLDRFFGEDADAKITMAEVKSEIVIELTVKYNNMIYRAEQSAADKEDALDASIDKIIRQIRRNKTRVEKRLKDTAFKDLAVAAAPDAAGAGNQSAAGDHYEVIRHKKVVMHPMSVEEAILQMNLLGHTFFMFTNANTGDMNVVYKRADGKYAVLEPIFD